MNIEASEILVSIFQKILHETTLDDKCHKSTTQWLNDIEIYFDIAIDFNVAIDVDIGNDTDADFDIDVDVDVDNDFGVDINIDSNDVFRSARTG